MGQFTLKMALQGNERDRKRSEIRLIKKSSLKKIVTLKWIYSFISIIKRTLSCVIKTYSETFPQTGVILKHRLKIPAKAHSGNDCIFFKLVGRCSKIFNHLRQFESDPNAGSSDIQKVATLSKNLKLKRNKMIHAVKHTRLKGVNMCLIML
jgi:hypothetical protein